MQRPMHKKPTKDVDLRNVVINKRRTLMQTEEKICDKMEVAEVAPSTVQPPPVYSDEEYAMKIEEQKLKRQEVLKMKESNRSIAVIFMLFPSLRLPNFPFISY